MLERRGLPGLLANLKDFHLVAFYVTLHPAMSVRWLVGWSIGWFVGRSVGPLFTFLAFLNFLSTRLFP